MATSAATAPTRSGPAEAGARMGTDVEYCNMCTYVYTVYYVYTIHLYIVIVVCVFFPHMIDMIVYNIRLDEMRLDRIFLDWIERDILYK